MSTSEANEWLVPSDQAGVRLDVFLAQQMPEFSRTFLRRLIDTDVVLVDGQRAKVAYRLHAGQRVRVQSVDVPRTGPEPEDIPLDVLYEDEHIAAINKPPGMVVHPARGHWSGTLTAALAFHFKHLSSVGGSTRPGIVHRLDRDTSGVIVVAKSDAAHMRLAAQFEMRLARKEYFAIVIGRPDRDRDQIELPIGPHPHQREKMAIRRDHPDARDAITFFEVVERFNRFAAVRVTPRTGRTHQIRLHLLHVGHPVLCDRLYGGRAILTRGELTGDSTDDEILLDRQALHAERLSLKHPISGAACEFVAPLPEDIQRTLEALRLLPKI